MQTTVMAIKRMIRPLIPDSLMARYRRRQHSRMVRSNVDLYVEDRRAARRWFRLTPDTYRVVMARPPSDRSVEAVVVGEPDDELTSYLGWHGSEVAVRADVLPPAMHRMRVVEPMMSPRSVALSHDTLADLHLSDINPRAVLGTALEAGLRVGVLPDVVDRDAMSPLPPAQAPIVVIFAAVPLHDIGGGSRGAQLAFELLRRSYSVVYVYRYPASESVDLGLRYFHPRLTQMHLERWELAAPVHGAEPGLVLVEAPMAEFMEPVTTLSHAGWTVVYDIIDDWGDRALGGDWYFAHQEAAFAELADGVVASAPDLVARAARFGAEATLVPNGVNPAIFHPDVDHPRPSGLPSGPLIGYHGSLYGDWFDWGSLARVANEFSDHTIVVIGDAAGARPPVSERGLPDNILFLGLQPQSALPGYLRALDVGLVPFTITSTTHAVSPLKVFEYLACSVPVAAPPLRALDGIEGVHTDTDLVAATRRAMAATRPDGAKALDEHGWGRRLGTLLGSVGRELQPLDGTDVRTLTRHTKHYAKGDRLVRS